MGSSIFIKSVNWIGDAIMTTPAIRRLRREYPAARIVVAARPWVAPVLDDNPDINEVWIEQPENGRGARKTLLSRLREEPFELGIAFPNSFGSAWLLKQGGVRQRIGYARDLRAWLLTDAVKCTKAIRRVHEVHYYRNLLRVLMEIDDEGDKPQLVLPVNLDAARKVDQALRDEGMEGDEPLIGVNPGAFFGSAKRWLPERFAAAADALAGRLDGRIVITGAPNERETGEAIRALCTRPAINLAGRLNLKGAVALIGRLRVMLTNDSGAMHIGAALGVPMVAIFGSTDWRTTYPYSDAARIVRRDTPCAPCMLRECPIDHRCMKDVSVDDVLTAAEELLAAVSMGR
ncbi:lipopolysaccharide heptosyltransferase II [Candidatus Sumerlaeota bacterium]|nr:lipopolysaccharide heptosyltransferase II [Candidatus Sumerlaeota bacterium]